MPVPILGAMDPNLIHVDWERTFEALTIIILLAFIIERALAIVFESRLYLRHVHRDGLKETIAFAVSILACWRWQFDAVSMIILAEQTQWPGYILTGGVIAGGSKVSIKLFHDVLNIKSSAYEQRYQLQAERNLETVRTMHQKVEEGPMAIQPEEAERRAILAVDAIRSLDRRSGESLNRETVSEADRLTEEIVTAAEQVRKKRRAE